MRLRAGLHNHLTRLEWPLESTVRPEMRVIVVKDPAELPPEFQGGALTIGNFDGVHVGHQALLQQTRTAAAGRKAVALTFEPHPVAVLAPDRAPARLTPPDEKIRQMQRCGIDAVVVLPTDGRLLTTTAADFVELFLAGPMHPAHIIEGPDFGFGAGRRGNVGTLRDLGRQFGFSVQVALPIEVDLGESEGNQVVSSSLIRALLSKGRVDAARICLGRNYALLGRVVAGAGVGRMLGYPTVNLDVAGQHLPADGVYAGTAALDDRAFPAAISIGLRPTFGENARVVEAFLLGEPGDLYGRRIRLEVRRWLRPQQKFPSPQALARQIGQDVQAVLAPAEGKAL